MTPLTEAQVNSAAFDQPHSTPRVKIIICSTPRSGSYLVCRAMIHHGIGVPHEYFNGLNASVIGARFGLGTIYSSHLAVNGPERRAYISALLQRRTVNGIFAAKIQGGQFGQYFKNAMSPTLFEGARFIYLYREDLLAQAISFHVSLLTGRWGPGNEATTAPVANPNFFDHNLIVNRMQIIADQDREWRLFLARNATSPLFLSYEAVRDNLAGALSRIAARLRLGISCRNFSYVEVPPTETAGIPSKSEIKARFLGIK
jgi:trehalose 2-sulfotransferase